MPIVPLSRIADARSGDKGEGSNVGVMARSEAAYVFLKGALSTEAVRRHMAAINRGGVKRYEADPLRVLNFLLADSLGGGGSASQRTSRAREKVTPIASTLRPAVPARRSAGERRSITTWARPSGSSTQRRVSTPLRHTTTPWSTA